MPTNIEWADETWNPITGCRRVSAGCEHCYAERMTRRLAAMGRKEYQGLLTPNGRFNGAVKFNEPALLRPLRWRKPRKIFVNSMSDLFGEYVREEWTAQIFAVMAATPQHTYMVLTKRPVRMLFVILSFNEGDEILNLMNRFADPDKNIAWPGWPLPNVRLGVSVENQPTADERIPALLATPAACRFVSAEPLLSEVDLIRYISPWRSEYQNNLDWVIAGGETGPNARPAHPDWFRSVRDQCVKANVPYFLKQLGPDKAAGRELDGRTWDEEPLRLATRISEPARSR